MQQLIGFHRELTDNNNIRIGERDGTPIEKGIVLNEDFLIKNEENVQNLMAYFSAYPDLFLDLITPADDGFTLFFYQRIMIRAVMRYKQIYITAPRAAAKSFITILCEFMECILMPGTKRFIVAPNKSQGARIAREKLYEIYAHWPILRREVVGGDVSETPGNFGEFLFANTF